MVHTVPRLTSFNYVLSCDITSELSVKVGGLDGKPPLPPVPHITETLYRGDFQQQYADLAFSCYIWMEGKVLTLPISTSYRVFTSRWQWNERLPLPYRVCDLPRNSYLICEVREPVAGEGAVVVGGAAVPLYNSDGVLQCGLVDVRIHFGLWTPEELVEKSERALLVRDEMCELGRLVKQHHAGEIEKVDWLDRLTFREVEHVNERAKQQNAAFHLSLEFPPVTTGASGSGTSDPMLAVVHHEGEEEVEPEPNNDICHIHDPELLQESLVEQKHFKLFRSLRNGPEAKNLKPNATTKHQLSLVIDYPTTRALTADEKDSIWLYRYYLATVKKALPKFLKCIDWTDEAEVRVAVELVEIWEPIDVEDALGLLSPQFTHSVVRMYAVKRLGDANDDDLRLYLLQLVQALKFDGEGRKTKLSPLGEFLIARACSNSYFGNYFYWYLCVECDDAMLEQDRDLYRFILRSFRTELDNRGAEGQRQRKLFIRQTELIKLLRDVMESPGKTRPQRVENMKVAIREKGLENFERDIPHPLDPRVRIIGIVPDKATLFKSSMMPARFHFKTLEGGEYVTIFKNGDDLRQDQLILQIVELMDKLLCKENLNLKLKPYRALATGPKHGFIQFVDSKAVATVIQEHGTILNYFQRQSPDHKTVSPEIMDTYTRSCAGYCVITYILGVGDRHLDNLMLTKYGHLLHIDFGYILGQDPKPFPPPMKLSKEMVEAMGGINSADYSNFREHCYNAFLILRRSAGLIINLFSLMLRANIQDIAIEPEGAVRKVEDKFSLDLSEEEAVQLFHHIIDASVSALFPALWETAHRFRQYIKR